MRLPFVLIFVATLSCAFASPRGQASDRFEQLVGTWRIIRYVVWDSAGRPTEPMGRMPSGYVVFTATGHAFVQLMEPGGGSFGAYYGPFRRTSDPGVLAVQIEGSNIPGYVGSTQTRPFRIDGDTLRLGVRGEYEATLARVPPR